MPQPPRSMKRGATPTPRHALAGAPAHIPLPSVPPNTLIAHGQISVWHNDLHGDCVTAEEAFAKACYNPPIFITDATVQTWATAHKVFDGANLLEVLNYMQKAGFSQSNHTYDDGHHQAVDWAVQATLASALCHGPVKIGVAADQLHATCQASNFESGWVATGYTQDQKYDHCVSLFGYGTLSWLAQRLNIALPAGADGGAVGYAMFTWGSVGIIDYASMMAITGEAWLRTPTTVIV